MTIFPMEAFFLAVGEGARFCIYYPPSTRSDLGLAAVFVPPFAEEMNKCRHVVAQAARRLSGLGIGILLIDLLGCGDSSGSLEDATWQHWRDDINLGTQWLRDRGHERLMLWGVRAGALLAMDTAVAAPNVYERCMLWQPVLSGETCLVQFLRLGVGSDIISGNKEGVSVASIRSKLERGEIVEIAGYRLTQALAADLAAVSLERFSPPCPVHWFEVVAEDGCGPSPGASRIAQSWRAAGEEVRLITARGDAFWSVASAEELVQCPALVDATAHAAESWT